jgi:hypothetical protein
MPNDPGTLDLDPNVVLRGAVLHVRIVNCGGLPNSLRTAARLWLATWLLWLIGEVVGCYIVFDQEAAAGE